MSSIADSTVLAAMITVFGGGGVGAVTFLLKRYFKGKHIAEEKKDRAKKEEEQLYQHLVKNLEPINTSKRGTVTSKTLHDVVDRLCSWQHDEALLSEYYHKPKQEYEALKNHMLQIRDELDKKGETGPIPSKIFDELLKEKNHLISKLQNDLNPRI